IMPAPAIDVVACSGFSPGGHAAVLSAQVDDLVNALEKAVGVTMRGTATTGSTLQSVWGQVIKTVTAGLSGQWEVTFAAGEVPVDGAYEIQVTPSDVRGNSSMATRAVTVDTTLDWPTMDTVAGDNQLNLSERGQNVVLSGTAEANAMV